MKGKLIKKNNEWFIEYREFSHCSNDIMKTSVYKTIELPVDDITIKKIYNALEFFQEEPTVCEQVEFIIVNEFGTKPFVEKCFARIVQPEPFPRWIDMINEFEHGEEYQKKFTNDEHKILLSFTSFLDKKLNHPSFKQ